MATQYRMSVTDRVLEWHKNDRVRNHLLADIAARWWADHLRGMVGLLHLEASLPLDEYVGTATGREARIRTKQYERIPVVLATLTDSNIAVFERKISSSMVLMLQSSPNRFAAVTQHDPMGCSEPLRSALSKAGIPILMGGRQVLEQYSGSSINGHHPDLDKICRKPYDDIVYCTMLENEFESVQVTRIHYA